MNKPKSQPEKKQHSKSKNATTKKTPARKLTAKEKAEFSEMNQIDWYPIDPYGD